MIYIALYKPFQVLSQFKKDGSTKKTLLDIIQIPEKPKAIGRLDYDSEGLLLLTNDIRFSEFITNPNSKIEKEYWVQVEGIPTENNLQPIREGKLLTKEKYLPAKIEIIPEPNLPPRNPPIRYRKSIPTTWLKLIINEGKNRQVRKMTASIGFPTLRLVRVRIGEISLDGLNPKEWKIISKEMILKK
jgi:23S rRNA pseudouridine2457 synthase